MEWMGVNPISAIENNDEKEEVNSFIGLQKNNLVMRTLSRLTTISSGTCLIGVCC